jgi:hypothetical protein
VSRRLQVVVSDDELRCYEQAAGALGLRLSAWVRQALGQSARSVATGDAEAKLEAVRRAYTHSFPAPDIDMMLEEIERGYLS